MLSRKRLSDITRYELVKARIANAAPAAANPATTLFRPAISASARRKRLARKITAANPSVASRAAASEPVTQRGHIDATKGIGPKTREVASAPTTAPGKKRPPAPRRISPGVVMLSGSLMSQLRRFAPQQATPSRQVARLLPLAPVAQVDRAAVS